MTLHKLQTERGAGDGASVQISLTTELYDLAGAVVRARAVRAIDLASRSLPIYRVFRWSVKRRVNELFDELACDAHFTAQRIDSGNSLRRARLRLAAEATKSYSVAQVYRSCADASTDACA